MNFNKTAPKDKEDINSILKFKDYTFEEVKPFVSDLLVCLQDMNWPIARFAADCLRPFLNSITMEIAEVFKSGDDMWKYWIIMEFLTTAECEIDIYIINELIRIRDNPTLGEIENEVNVVAQKALAHLRNE